MRRRCKSLAECAWTYNPGAGESKNPMASKSTIENGWRWQASYMIYKV